jgi:hypothetical protein
MPMRSGLRAGLAAGLITAFCVAGPAVADGLQRFQQDIAPKLRKSEFAYEKAAPLGANGFVLEKVTVFSPPQGGRSAQPELRIARLEVEALDFDGFAAGEARFARVAAKGIVVPENGTYGTDLRPLGAAASPADGRLDYRYDPGSQVLTVNRFDLTSGRDQFSLEMVLDKVRSLRDTRTWDAGVSVRSVRIVNDNHQTLARVLRILGARSGKTEDVLQREWLSRISQASAGKAPRTTRAADAIASFLQDYRQPKGPLTVTMRPAQPVPFALMLAALFLPDPAQVVGLAATYPATRPGAAALAR